MGIYLTIAFLVLIPVAAHLRGYDSRPLGDWRRPRD